MLSAQNFAGTCDIIVFYLFFLFFSSYLPFFCLLRHIIHYFSTKTRRLFSFRLREHYCPQVGHFSQSQKEGAEHNLLDAVFKVVWITEAWRFMGTSYKRHGDLMQVMEDLPKTALLKLKKGEGGGCRTIVITCEALIGWATDRRPISDSRGFETWVAEKPPFFSWIVIGSHVSGENTEIQQ